MRARPGPGQVHHLRRLGGCGARDGLAGEDNTGGGAASLRGLTSRAPHLGPHLGQGRLVAGDGPDDAAGLVVHHQPVLGPRPGHCGLPRHRGHRGGARGQPRPRHLAQLRHGLGEGILLTKGKE